MGAIQDMVSKAKSLGLSALEGPKELADKAIDKAKQVGQDVSDTVGAYNRAKIPKNINFQKLRQEAANRSAVEPDGTENK